MVVVTNRQRDVRPLIFTRFLSFHDPIQARWWRLWPSCCWLSGFWQLAPPGGKFTRVSPIMFSLGKIMWFTRFSWVSRVISAFKTEPLHCPCFSSFSTFSIPSLSLFSTPVFLPLSFSSSRFLSHRLRLISRSLSLLPFFSFLLFFYLFICLSFLLTYSLSFFLFQGRGLVSRVASRQRFSSCWLTLNPPFPLFLSGTWSRITGRIAAAFFILLTYFLMIIWFFICCLLLVVTVFFVLSITNCNVSITRDVVNQFNYCSRGKVNDCMSHNDQVLSLSALQPNLEWNALSAADV